jgi:hypothetical protein
MSLNETLEEAVNALNNRSQPLTSFVASATSDWTGTVVGLASSLLIDQVFTTAWSRMAAGVALAVVADPALASAV